MTASVHREWIATEFAKGIEAERELAEHAKSRAEAPTDPELTVLYNEIAAADGRHRAAIERVAIRYGHTPSRDASGGGIASTLKSLKERITDSMTPTGPLQRLGEDLAAKANSIHWYTAWVHAFKTFGDTESSRELAEILAEENAHRDALQQALNQHVIQGATAEEPAARN